MTDADLAAELRRAGATLHAYRRSRAAEARRGTGVLWWALRLLASVLPGKAGDDK